MYQYGSHLYQTTCNLFLLKFLLFMFEKYKRNRIFNDLSLCLGFNHMVFHEIGTNMATLKHCLLTSQFVSKSPRTQNIMES